MILKKIMAVLLQWFDYLRYSDNYYHSNLLLLGSYPKQSLQNLSGTAFCSHKIPEAGLHWPYFSYNGKQYWLNGFENWPGYINGKANFGSDSSFVSIGLFNNYGIYTYIREKVLISFHQLMIHCFFVNAYKKSGFILPEYALFDQKGTGMDNGEYPMKYLSSVFPRACKRKQPGNGAAGKNGRCVW